MNIVYMGTPELAAIILEKLHTHHTVAGVYTRPDAVRGRGKKLEGSPVKQVAEKLGLPVYTPKTLRNKEVIEEIRSLKPDVICVAAYGAILPKEVLDIPQYGCLNVHGSLLPRWRGAAPIERAILSGDEKTGVCIMRMEEGLDTGDYCVVRTVDINEKPACALTEELACEGAKALVEALDMLEQGSVEWVSQDDSLANYAEKISKQELYLNPSDTVLVNARRVQAASKAHPARCVIANKEVSVWRALALPEEDELAGTINQGEVQLIHKRLFIACSDGMLELFEVQPQGKKTMDAKAFAAGIQGIKQSGHTWEVLNA